MFRVGAAIGTLFEEGHNSLCNYPALRWGLEGLLSGIWGIYLMGLDKFNSVLGYRRLIILSITHGP